MRTDAGWRKEDGTEKEMWRCQSAPTCPTKHVDEDTTASSCPYGLLIATVKEGKEWDAQPLEIYLCHLGTKTGTQCSSRSEKCYESFVQSVQPDSHAARAARTGSLDTAS